MCKEKIFLVCKFYKEKKKQEISWTLMSLKTTKEKHNKNNYLWLLAIEDKPKLSWIGVQVEKD